MALVICPDEGWNSFLTIEEADALIPTMTSDGKWLALPDSEKEILLVNSTSYIRAIATVDSDCDQCDFKTAQAMVIQTDLVSGGEFLGFESSSNEYESVKVSSISVTYAGNKKSTDYDNIPAFVSGILRDCLIVSDAGGVTTGFNLAF